MKSEDIDVTLVETVIIIVLSVGTALVAMVLSWISRFLFISFYSHRIFRTQEEIHFYDFGSCMDVEQGKTHPDNVTKR